MEYIITLQDLRNDPNFKDQCDICKKPVGWRMWKNNFLCNNHREAWIDYIKPFFYDFIYLGYECNEEQTDAYQKPRFQEWLRSMQKRFNDNC